MSFLTVTTPLGVEWQMALSEEEVPAVEKMMDKEVEPAGILWSAITPIRTNSVRNFVKDMGFPTMNNRAIHVENAALRFFAVAAAFTLDVLTLTIRLITCIPRAIYNASLGEHALVTFLKDKGAKEKITQADYVEAKLTTTSKEQSGETVYEDGSCIPSYTIYQKWRSRNVAFIQLPQPLSFGAWETGTRPLA